MTRHSAFLSASFILCFFLFSDVVFADNVSSFVFITEPQTIGAGVTSKEITVQAQNASGTSEPISETFDLSFSSNSGTGQFLNSTGNAVSTTMSKSTANRTFYYRDASIGDFTLTVTATARTSLRTFSASQHIFVGVSGGASGAATSTSTSETSSSGSGTSSTQSSTSSNTQSAHSSPSPLSDLENKMEFEISAGRDRLTSVGTNLSFQASPTRLQNVNEQSIFYRWSFGDGTTGEGKSITHAYRFSGEYAVVLNATYSDKQAVSRLKVKVISPDISIARVLGGLEVANKSSAEINMEGWSLIADKKTFIFPKDTLIPAGKKVVFADEVTGIFSGNIQLSNPLNKMFSEIKEVQNQVAGNVPEMSLEEIQAKVDEVKKTLAQANAVTATSLSVAPIYSPSKTVVAEIATSSQTANAITVFEAPAQTGIISSIFSWPSRSFQFIKHLFVEE